MSIALRDLHAELESIRDQYSKLSAPVVVDAAREPSHPLHSRFEWDDTIAGHQYRLQQARELIRSVRIVYKEADETGPEQSVRAYVSLANESEQSYEPVNAVAQNPLQRQMALNAMQREWKALYRRYQEFEEFAAMVRQDLLAEVA
jgi:hypothetical protein